MSVFDRDQFVKNVAEAFQKLEHLLGAGNAFNYSESALFSGVVNGSKEHVVIVPLTDDSDAVETQRELGTDRSWLDTPAFPLFGFLILPKTDCIHTLVPDVPYLARAYCWERAELVDEHGMKARDFVIWAHRGDPKRAWFTFRGNVQIHLWTCWTASSNQI